MPDPIDLDAIEARARAATQGEWVAEYDGGGAYAVDAPTPHERIAHILEGDRADKDAAHIAGLSPPVVLALIAEVRRLRRIEEAARAHMAVEDSSATGAQWYATQDALEAALRAPGLDAIADTAIVSAPFDEDAAVERAKAAIDRMEIGNVMLLTTPAGKRRALRAALRAALGCG